VERSPSLALRGCDFLNVAQSLRDWDFERHSFSGDFRVFDESRRLGISVAVRLSYKNSHPFWVSFVGRFLSIEKLANR
jgi:hypothetical protein